MQEWKERTMLQMMEQFDGLRILGKDGDCEKKR